MKPVDSYSAMNTRLDRSTLNEGARKTGNGSADTGKSEAPSAISSMVAQLGRSATSESVQGAAVISKSDMSGSISTTAPLLATAKPPFDAQKVSDIKQQIASGSYKVDTDALAAKMLDAGVLGVEPKK